MRSTNNWHGQMIRNSNNCNDSFPNSITNIFISNSQAMICSFLNVHESVAVAIVSCVLSIIALSSSFIKERAGEGQSKRERERDGARERERERESTQGGSEIEQKREQEST